MLKRLKLVDCFCVFFLVPSAGRVGRPVRFQMTHEHLLQVTPLATLLGDLQLNLRHVLLQLAHADE